MNSAGAPKDLVVLAADKNMEYTLKGLLGRPKALGVRELAFDTYVHANRDHGCFQEAHTFLSAFSGRYAHALVILDRDGCGREKLSRTEIELEIEGRLASNGWDNRAAAIVLDPELEIWVWSDSPNVDKALGWPVDGIPLRDALARMGFLAEGAVKPADPKAAMEFALRKAGIARSSSVYGQLAGRVSLNRCQDPAMNKFRSILHGWFPSL